MANRVGEGLIGPPRWDRWATPGMGKGASVAQSANRGGFTGQQCDVGGLKPPGVLSV